MKINITSRYGDVDRLHPNGHTGIDFSLNEGSILRSVMDGVVQKVVDYGPENIGKGVLVQFSDGTTGVYGHMSRIIVREGQKVAEGQQLGYSGNSGFSTGPHLHFGLKENGHFIDPTPLADTVGEYTGGVWDQFKQNGDVTQNDYPTVWGWLYEKTFGNGIEHFVADYLSALPLLAVVALGIFGLCNMFSRTFANCGVGLTFVLGGLAIL
jgi:murein DD-endopeptidase MepM/ murein hydrolase activator NlpD